MKKIIAGLLAIMLAVSLAVSAAAASVTAQRKSDASDTGLQKEYSYTMHTVDGEEITQDSLIGKVTVFVFFSVSDNNGFLTLDDIQCSDWVKDPKVQVIAADTSGRTGSELRDYREYYGFQDILFCAEESEDELDEIEADMVKNLSTKGAASPLVAVTDQSGTIRHLFTGYQRPDDLKGYVQELTAAPEPPSDVRAYRLDNGKISLIWSRVSGKASYEVYRSDRPNGEYSLLETAETNGTADGEQGLWYYKIRCVEKRNGTLAYSEFTGPVSVAELPEAPSAELKMEGDLTAVLFTAASTADGFLVRRSDDGGQTFSEEVELGPSGAYLVTGAEEGVVLRVCSFADTDLGREYSFSTECHVG